MQRNINCKMHEFTWKFRNISSLSYKDERDVGNVSLLEINLEKKVEHRVKTRGKRKMVFLILYNKDIIISCIILPNNPYAGKIFIDDAMRNIVLA